MIPLSGDIHVITRQQNGNYDVVACWKFLFLIVTFLFEVYLLFTSFWNFIGSELAAYVKTDYSYFGGPSFSLELNLKFICYLYFFWNFIGSELAAMWNHSFLVGRPIIFRKWVLARSFVALSFESLFLLWNCFELSESYIYFEMVITLAYIVFFHIRMYCGFLCCYYLILRICFLCDVPLDILFENFCWWQMMLNRGSIKIWS